MSPDQPPPTRYLGAPRRFQLLADTVLTRLHKARFGVTDFNPTVARSAYAGGRFDATPDDAYPFLYGADDDATAVSETLLRDVPSDEHGDRILPAAVGQDTWLTTASEYALTRRWASAIREWAPWAQGLTWRSRREPDGFAYVLFADRCPEACLEEAVNVRPLPPDGRDLEYGLGRLYLEDLLIPYRVAVM